MNRRGLGWLLGDDPLALHVQRLGREFESLGLDPRRLEMLRYALKLTLRPAEMERADVERLLALGFGDADVLAIAEVTGYYAYVNRIADGLGVKLE